MPMLTGLLFRESFGFFFEDTLVTSGTLTSLLQPTLEGPPKRNPGEPLNQTAETVKRRPQGTAVELLRRP